MTIIKLYNLSDENIEELNSKTNQSALDIHIANDVLSAQIDMINGLIDVYDNIITEHDFKFARNLFEKGFKPFENHHLDDFTQLDYTDKIFSNLNEILKGMQMDTNATSTKNSALLLELTHRMLPIFNTNLDKLFAIVDKYELAQFNPLLQLNRYEDDHPTLVATIDSLKEHRNQIKGFEDQLDDLANNNPQGVIKYVIRLEDRLTLPSAQGNALIESIIFDAKEQLLKKKEGEDN